MRATRDYVAGFSDGIRYTPWHYKRHQESRRPNRTIGRKGSKRQKGQEVVFSRPAAETDAKATPPSLIGCPEGASGMRTDLTRTYTIHPLFRPCCVRKSPARSCLGLPTLPSANFAPLHTHNRTRYSTVQLHSSTCFPMHFFRKNSRLSQANCSSGMPGARPSFGACREASDSCISGGGPWAPPRPAEQDRRGVEMGTNVRGRTNRRGAAVGGRKACKNMTGG